MQLWGEVQEVYVPRHVPQHQDVRAWGARKAHRAQPSVCHHKCDLATGAGVPNACRAVLSVHACVNACMCV